MMAREPYSPKPPEQPDDKTTVNEALNQVFQTLAPLTNESKRRILDAARVFFRVESGLR